MYLLHRRPCLLPHAAFLGLAASCHPRDHRVSRERYHPRYSLRRQQYAAAGGGRGRNGARHRFRLPWSVHVSRVLLGLLRYSCVWGFHKRFSNVQSIDIEPKSSI